MLVGLNATSLGAAGSGVIPTRTPCRGSLKPTRGNRAARLHVPRCNLGRRTFFETHDLASCRVVCGRASGFPSGHDRGAGEGVSPLAGHFLPGGLERRRFLRPRLRQQAPRDFVYPFKEAYKAHVETQEARLSEELDFLRQLQARERQHDFALADRPASQRALAKTADALANMAGDQTT